MMPIMMLPAQMMATAVTFDPAKPARVLDIEAGHGIFGITFAQRNPNLSVIALDWPSVLKVAEENARKMGVGDRYSLLPGSAFEVDFGQGYDLILLTNFLHHFDVPTCERLLKKVYAALAPGGRAATLEFVVNEDRVSPPSAASFSLMMLATTPSGDAYTFSEYQQMFQAAGFARSALHPLPPSPNQMIVSHK
jgi:ubiquinone/menaquinone biosynthesis C-methylase UbiE